MTDDPRKVDFRDAMIDMSHGAGGTASRRLIEGLVVPLLGNPELARLGDAAELRFGSTRLAVTADGFVVRPLVFPGGSIGMLAVNGTVNDLAVSGARPSAILATWTLEAGLESAVVAAELTAMATAAAAAGTVVLGGDTKVVEHGRADGIYISTFGIGEIDPRARLGPEHVRAGDRILLSGPIGDHGIAVLLARGDVTLEADIRSDSRPLTPSVLAMLDAAGGGLRWMRDATRGGVASALNELARAAGLGLVLAEDRVPVRDAVRGACELLGLDPLHVANEGQLVAIVAPERAEATLAALRRCIGSEDAADVGQVCEEPAGLLVCEMPHGGRRVVSMLTGDPLPRIC